MGELKTRGRGDGAIRDLTGAPPIEERPTPEPIALEPAPMVPETVRDPNLSARASVTSDGRPPARTNVPHSSPASASALASAGQTIQEVKALLSRSVLDWAVTDRDAKKALAKIASLTGETKLAALDSLGPELLSRLEENLSSKDRRANAGAVSEIRMLRNTPGSAPDPAQFLAKAMKTLVGFADHSMVRPEDAREIIDGLRRFDDLTLSPLLDELGPLKLYRLKARLSPLDKEVYAPSLARISGAHFGAVLKAEAALGLGPKDRTSDFQQILAQVEAKTLSLGEEAKGFAYLLVPGLVTEHQSGYFEENKKRLESRGLLTRISKIDTDGDVPTNAAQIREEIKALAAETGKRVVVLSHSKGGPDAALALRDPETESKTALFISMQAAYGGTPIAETLTEGRLQNVLSQALTQLLKASSGNAFSDLSFKEQKARWLGAPPLSVCVLNLATTVGSHASGLAPISSLWENTFGCRSDGLVPLESQQIGSKNAYVAIMTDLDHAAPAARPLAGFLAPVHTPGDITETLVLHGLSLISAG